VRFELNFYAFITRNSNFKELKVLTWALWAGNEETHRKSRYASEPTVWNQVHTKDLCSWTTQTRHDIRTQRAELCSDILGLCPDHIFSFRSRLI